MPPRYVLVSILCSFGGFLFGIDTGIIGPVTVMKSYTSYFGSQSAIIHGVIVSSILIPAAFSSCVAGRVADLLGRPKGIAIGALIFGIGTALEASSVRLAMFIVGRCIEGIGEGLYLGVLVVYICEISPPSKRGPLTTGPQLFVTFGLVVGFFTCYGTANINSSMSWRLPFIVLSCLSIIFATASLIWLVPSPRWLKLRGRGDEASAAWDLLGVSHAEREKAEIELNGNQEIQLRTTNDVNSTERQDIPSQGPPKLRGFFDVFSKDVRKRTALAIFMMGMQQLSGIDGVLYYAPLLFEKAGLASTEASFLASGVSALVIFAVTIPALFLADKWGRRSSTIYGGLGLSFTMFLIGILYASSSVHPHSGAGRWVVIICIYIFAVIFSITWAVCFKVYSAEIQPQRTRASATSLAHGSNWLSNFLVALTTPVLLAKSNFAVYFLFGGCTLFAVAVCYLFMPETKGRSLEEIEEAFKRRRTRMGGLMTGVNGLLRRRVVG